jgi:hypothetical protein
MDWGLAKVLDDTEAGGAPGSPPPDSEVENPRAPGAGSQAGVALGTYAYMAPEQARGEVGRIDLRADVFGLGAILCEVLTGQPAYRGDSREQLYFQALMADLGDAYARLGASGADAELVALAKGCLAPDREARPRDAGEVARAVAAYRAGVEERARKAELERAAAQARAEEARAKARAERRARRLTVGLAATVLLARSALALRPSRRSAGVRGSVCPGALLPGRAQQRQDCGADMLRQSRPGGTESGQPGVHRGRFDMLGNMQGRHPPVSPCPFATWGPVR